MKYHEMTKNYIFREFECGLSVEQVAEFCLKTVRTVKEWEKGKPIPLECKRLMRMTKGRELSSSEQWEHFKMHHDRLELRYNLSDSVTLERNTIRQRLSLETPSFFK
ncbi:hypothetical protein [Vibrio harveyi]|uniref:hypothetical protein n=1 Tax=Vibrio harveyi TaxID=669 RepID=UPI0033965162